MSLLDTASLIVTPNGYKEGTLYSVIPSDGSGDMSVVRATTATRVNIAGLVELVPYNLVRYSQEISNTSFWAHYLANLTANTTTAPDGTTTADTIAITGASGSAYQFVTYSDGVHTLSCYFKKINEDNVYMDGNSSSGYYGASFNLTTQATTLFGGGFSPSIESVGNGWYRCSVQSNGSGSGSYGFGIYASGGQSAYIWGAQLNEGSLKDYQKTETRLNIPRLDYSNGTCPSLLVEPQRTNYIWYSSSFDVSGAWGAIDTTITGNTTISPSGIQDAETMTITSSTSRIFQTLALGAGTYTASIYVKSLSGTPTIQFRMVVDGTDITESIPTTTDWVRHDFTFTATIAVSFFVIRGVSGTGSVAIWGSQLEVGTYPTSYIPTTSASVTRNADVVSKTGISSLIGQTEGTMFCDSYINISNNQLSGLLGITNTVENFIYLFYIGNQVYQQTNIGGTLNTTYIATIPSSGRYKIALAYKSNDFSFYINGTQVWQTTTASVPTCSDVSFQNATLGINSGSNINANALWKTRLTNTQLAQLTTI